MHVGPQPNVFDFISFYLSAPLLNHSHVENQCSLFGLKFASICAGEVQQLIMQKTGA